MIGPIHAGEVLMAIGCTFYALTTFGKKDIHTTTLAIVAACGWLTAIAGWA